MNDICHEVGETRNDMKKKAGIVVFTVMICLILTMSVAGVFAQDGYLINVESRVEAGQDLNFRVDLEKITEEEYGDYTMSVNIDPPEPVVRIGVKENVNITENPATNTYMVSSADLRDVRALNFTLIPDESIEEQTTFRVTVKIVGQQNVTEEDFTFEVMPKKPDPTEPTDPTDPTDPTEPTDSTKPSEPTTSPTKPSVPTTAPTEKMQMPPDAGGSDAKEEADPKLVYKGSSDNYLKTLQVEGYDFTRQFNKTKNTYFIDVKGSVDSLKVYAEPCDKDAKVDIVGNDNLISDTGKISVTVKASNGDVRVYRIYIRQK